MDYLRNVETYMLFLIFLFNQANGQTATISEAIGDTVVEQGQNAGLHCKVNNYVVDRTKVEWFRLKPYFSRLEIVKISENDVVQSGTFEGKYDINVTVNNDVRVTSLTVNNVGDADVGIYRCRVTIKGQPYTVWPKKDGRILLSANGQTATISEAIGDTVVEQGQNAGLHCKVNNYVVDRTKVEWFRLKPYFSRLEIVKISENDVVQSGTFEGKYDINVTVNNDVRVTSLTVNNVGDADVGIYRCRVTIKGQPYTVWPKKDGRILLSAPPTFVDGLQTSYVSDIGGSIELICRAQGSPEPRIKWYKNDLMTELGHGEVLSLTNLKMVHYGLYICVADNGVGTARLNYTVNVNFAPVCSFDENSVGQAPNIAAILSSTCFVQGHPPAEIEWYRVDESGNETPVSLDDDRIMFHSIQEPIKQFVMSTIMIDNVTDSDYGSYRCLSTNSKGACQTDVRFYETATCQGPMCGHTMDDGHDHGHIHHDPHNAGPGFEITTPPHDLTDTHGHGPHGTGDTSDPHAPHAPHDPHGSDDTRTPNTQMDNQGAANDEHHGQGSPNDHHGHGPDDGHGHGHGHGPDGGSSAVTSLSTLVMFMSCLSLLVLIV